MLQQKISNNTQFKEVERTIQIAGIALNFDAQLLDIYYRINYFKNSTDLSQMFSRQVPEWHIDNNQRILVRDENFNPIPNPEYKEQKDQEGNILNDTEKFLTEPAFDYVSNIMLNTPAKLSDILRNYIIEQDNDGRFNF
ncbi:MAG: hypothetical protein REI96_06905 [Flavobacterium nitrogenifigens]|uniref:hypothetical protein n=1 Tax=Flavobacterium nitrogenifigens TaxID=1617283 RepID=UPI00280721FD|nr:hypothetical protein [Flavobacterium nitrogenifigens]MDQ8012157.1 hypothetical protein [Flavobacterium nitrogenifigens]